MSKWSKIYEEQIAGFVSLDVFIANKLLYKKKLIDIIKKYSLRTKKIIEVGCGSGITSIFLEKSGYHVTGIDSDQDMIRLSVSIALRQNSSAIFKVADMTILDTLKERFDVVFSNGVMEHFSNEDIISITDHHLSISDYVVISIPSDYFSANQRIYGNERFMGVNQWRSILAKTKGSIVEEFSFDSDKIIKHKPQFIGFVLSSL